VLIANDVRKKDTQTIPLWLCVVADVVDSFSCLVMRICARRTKAFPDSNLSNPSTGAMTQLMMHNATQNYPKRGEFPERLE
jgi:hypothetical protein